MSHRLPLSLLVLLLAAPAVAADPAADALITRGLELRRQGQSAEALEMFRRAHTIEATPRTLGQMGLVETSLQHWLDAELHLRASLAASSDPWVKKTQALLDKALEVASQHVGELDISGPARTNIFIGEGDDPPRTLPLRAPIRLAEGDVRVSSVAPGFKPLDQTVRIEGRARTALTLALQPIETATPRAPDLAAAPGAPSPSLPAEVPPSRHAPRWVPWTVGGLFVAAVTAGAWGGAWVAVDGSSACGSMSKAGCDSVYDTRTPGLILVSGGVAAAAAGITLWLMNR